MTDSNMVQIIGKLKSNAFIFPSPFSVVRAGTIWNSRRSGQKQNIKSVINAKQSSIIPVLFFAWQMAMSVGRMASLGYASASGKAIAAIGSAASAYVLGFTSAIAGFALKGSGYAPTFGSTFIENWQKLGYSDVVRLFNSLGEADSNELLDNLVLSFPTAESIKGSLYTPLMEHCIQNVPKSDWKYITGQVQFGQDNISLLYNKASKDIQSAIQMENAGDLGILLEMFNSHSISEDGTDAVVQAIENQLDDMFSQTNLQGDSNQHSAEDTAYAWLEAMNFTQTDSHDESDDDSNDSNDVEAGADHVNLISGVDFNTTDVDLSDNNAPDWLTQMDFTGNQDHDDSGDQDHSEEADMIPMIHILNSC